MAKAKAARGKDDTQPVLDDETKTKKRKKTNSAAKSSRSTPIFPPLISFLLLSLIAAASYFLSVAPLQNNAQEKQATLYAQTQARLIEQSLAQLQQRLDLTARSRSVLKVAKEKDTATLNKMAKELGARFPESVNVLLIPLDAKGLAGLRQHDIKLRNNIEASLVNRAVDGEPTYAEAYSYRQRMEFTLVAPVTDSDGLEVNGAVLLRMPISYLQAALESLEANSGETVLLHKFAQKDTVLLSAGTSVNAENSNNTLDVQLKNSTWWIRFLPSSAVKAAAGTALWLLLGLLALPCILLPLWHFLSLRNVAGKYNEDLDSLGKYAESLAAGNKRMPPVFNHSKVTHLAELLVGQRRKASAPTKKQPMVDAGAAPAMAVSAGVSAGIAAAAIKAPSEPEQEGEPEPAPRSIPNVKVPDSIFREYDIRGDADKYFTDEVVHAIGMAVGSEAIDRGQEYIVVATDGRVSSPRIKQALCAGLKDSGQHILDIGQLPTTLLYFATHQLETGAGVMITGSHNDAHYNGLKLVIDGRPLAGEHIKNIQQRIIHKRFHFGDGTIEQAEVADEYVNAIISDVAVAEPLKVVIDAGNGIGGVIGPRVLEELGCEVIELHCEVDGTFPNHAPDPTIAANLQDLIQAVQQHSADFGIALDGDADRVCVVDAQGNAIAPDILLMLFAQDIVSRNPGADIVYDVKCTRHLSKVISRSGGRPIMWKSGHSCIKEKMLETGALLGGEFTGHICFKERWYGFDDGIYSAARLIEIVSTSGLKLDELIQEYPSSISTPEIIIKTGEEQKFEILDALSANATFGDGKLTTLDGIRVDYPDGWGLIRPSNTVAAITLRFEADDEEALQRIQAVFRDQVGLINPALASAF